MSKRLDLLAPWDAWSSSAKRHVLLNAKIRFRNMRPRRPGPVDYWKTWSITRYFPYIPYGRTGTERIGSRWEDHRSERPKTHLNSTYAIEIRQTPALLMEISVCLSEEPGTGWGNNGLRIIGDSCALVVQNSFDSPWFGLNKPSNFILYSLSH